MALHDSESGLFQCFSAQMPERRTHQCWTFNFKGKKEAMPEHIVNDIMKGDRGETETSKELSSSMKN